MKSYIRVPVVWSMLLLSVTLCQAGEPRGPFSSLHLTIATPKGAFVQLEPIPIMLTLMNPTEQPVKGHSGLGFSQRLLDLYVSDNRGIWEKVRNLSLLSLPAAPKRIDPGTHDTTTELLLLDLDKIFPKGGPYKIKALLSARDRKEYVESNTLSLEIREPEGFDAVALKYIRDEANPSSFLSGHGIFDSQKAQGVLESFVSLFEHSTYGVYAKHLLGRVYALKKRYEEAELLLGDVAETKGFVLADEALCYLVEASVNRNDKDRADRYYQLLTTKFPESDYIERAEEAILSAKAL